MEQGSQKKNIRLLAVKALLAIHRDKAYANITLQEAIHKEQLSDLDRRFFTELVYGVVRRRNYLDAIIEELSGRPIRKQSAVVLEILRLMIYQLIYMDKVPASAAINESVKLAKKLARGMDRFVNAVGRNVDRKREELSIDELSKSEAERLSFIYNQPLWLVELWLEQLGEDATIDMCDYFNTHPLLTAKVNTLVTTVDEVVSAMEEAGWVVEVSERVPHAIHIHKHLGSLEQSPFVKNGWITFMDEASMLVGLVAAPKPGQRVLDCCAAPGGKSLHMAALMENKGEIVSGDIHPHKITLMEESAKRLGVTSMKARVHDATTFTEEDREAYDVVLVDAPCSGLGVLQKKLDMRWRKEPQVLTELPALQGRILEAASQCVKPGGVLVYSTCTINRLENEAVVEAFLTTHPQFTVEDASPYIPFPVKGPMVSIMPAEHRMDGFFMARLIKEST